MKGWSAGDLYQNSSCRSRRVSFYIVVNPTPAVASSALLIVRPANGRRGLWPRRGNWFQCDTIHPCALGCPIERRGALAVDRDMMNDALFGLVPCVFYPKRIGGLLFWCWVLSEFNDFAVDDVLRVQDRAAA
jgi:hypothetical protein